MPSVVTMILAGGQGTRLFPLTKDRSKPAVPIAGKFRLIDIPISNCIHSNYRKIYIITQFAAESLHRHISTTYRFSIFSKDFITILAAQQTMESKEWYQGTADAVRQNLRFIDSYRDDDLVLILSGDHLYRMDYSEFVRYHLDNEADISIAVIPISRDRASQFGIMKIKDNCQIETFHEKPKEAHVLDELTVPPEVFRQQNIDPGEKTHLASMGIYVFKKKVLRELLEATNFSDFGKEVIPTSLKKYRVFAFFFDGYWEDIGTIKSFFQAQIELTDIKPRFNFYDEDRPIFSHPRFLPGAKVIDASISKSILCDGSIIDPSVIQDSIIGIRSRVGKGSKLSRVIMMGADYFETEKQLEENKKLGRPNIGIGENCVIEQVIIDKNARIGNNVKIEVKDRPQTASGKDFVIADGIVVIPKGATIPDGSVIPPR